MLRKIISSLAAGAALVAVLPGIASAGPVPGFKMGSGGIHPPVGLDSQYRSGGLENEWLHVRDWQFRSWQGTAHSYNAALTFARCAARFNPASLALIERPIGANGDREALARFVYENRACVGEQAAVAPMLIRAALAETAMTAGRAPRALNVGLPQTVDTYPLAEVSRCLVEKAPASVAAMMSTRPGDEAERAAAQSLFSQHPECAPRRTLRLTPTAARLALVDAVYRQGAGGQ